ncbi:MAG: hypothetical protein RL145_1651 [Pseudomonadota bacterium]|jgi:hypothetical protein
MVTICVANDVLRFGQQASPAKAPKAIGWKYG